MRREADDVKSRALMSPDAPGAPGALGALGVPDARVRVA